MEFGNQGPEPIASSGSNLPGQPQVSRRKFFKFLTWLGGIFLALKLVPTRAKAKEITKAKPFTIPPLPDVQSKMLRMQREVQECIGKPASQRDWIMAIDLDRCVGCNACTVACATENQLPPGVIYMPVMEQERGRYPDVTRHFLPRPCMQCNVPPCVPVCPVNATYKQEDGVVPVDYDRCIGCRACITACPYGARTFDFGEMHTSGTPNSPQPYETATSPEYGENRVRHDGEPPIGVVRKCHFCLHRLHEGMLPACVTTCMAGAIYFGPGPTANPKSLVSQKINDLPFQRLKEDLGTEPRVFYLNSKERP